jgi:hypothetical protein
VAAASASVSYQTQIVFFGIIEHLLYSRVDLVGV